MNLQFEIFIVLDEKYRENLLVTTSFNDALERYFKSEGVNKVIEVWDEGKCTAVYASVEDFIKAGRVKALMRK